MKVEMVEARLEHAISLIENLRGNERELYKKVLGEDFERLVVKEINESVMVWAAFVDGECGVLWGVKMEKIMSDEGVLWLLGGHLIDKNPITFLRHSKRALEDLRGTFKLLHGCVLTQYTQSRKWLEWLGFEIGEDQGGICRCVYRFV